MARRSGHAVLGRRRALTGVAASLIAVTSPVHLLRAAPLTYPLEPVPVAPGTWVLFGDNSGINRRNGGFIANTVIIEVPAGIVLISSGPSRRFGRALVDVLRRLMPSREVIRVYNTHHHPDHIFGNQVFGSERVASTAGVIESFAREAEGLSDNMYRLAGDWMRGTRVTPPGIVLRQPTEVVGGRRFSYFYLSGHSADDLVIRDDLTGLLFPGDLVFYNRAPATPHADLAQWQKSLQFLQTLNPGVLVPGHGPLDTSGESIVQTGQYLAWLDETLRDAVQRGLTMNEAMALPIPQRFKTMAFVREEYRRSVVHLYQRLEDELFQPVRVTR